MEFCEKYSFRILLQHLRKILMTVIVGWIIGFILMNVAFLLPNDNIVKNIKKSAAIMVEQSDYFSYGQGGPSVDNYTDAIYLNESMVDYRHHGLLITSLSGLRYHESRLATTEELFDAVNDKHGFNKVTPAERRFWNGYIFPLRLLLSFMDIILIRKFNFVLQLFLLLCLIKFMINKGLTLFVPAITLAYLFLDPLTVGSCLAFSGFIYCSIIPCYFIIVYNDKLISKNLYPIFFCAIGSCACFFNMNYFQLLSFGIPIGFYYIVNRKDGFKQITRRIAILFLAWIFGYFGMMLGKWIIYAVFVDINIFSDMYQNIVFRLSANNYQTISFTRLDAVVKNFSTALLYTKNIWIIQGLYTAILLFVLGIKHKYTDIEYVKVITTITLMSLILVVLRYFIFANHVFIHSWVMYRLIAIPIFIFDILLASGLKNATFHDE